MAKPKQYLLSHRDMLRIQKVVRLVERMTGPPPQKRKGGGTGLAIKRAKATSVGGTDGTFTARLVDDDGEVFGEELTVYGHPDRAETDMANYHPLVAIDSVVLITLAGSKWHLLPGLVNINTCT